MAKILVVDDDPRVLANLKKALENRGHTVLLAGGGLQGIDDASVHKPDLIITDLVMPLVDGLELTRKVRTAGLLMPIIMYCAGISAADRPAILRSGVGAVVDKDARVEKLLAAIDDLLVATPLTNP